MFFEWRGVYTTDEHLNQRRFRPFDFFDYFPVIDVSCEITNPLRHSFRVRIIIKWDHELRLACQMVRKIRNWLFEVVMSKAWCLKQEHLDLRCCIEMRSYVYHESEFRRGLEIHKLSTRGPQGKKFELSSEKMDESSWANTELRGGTFKYFTVHQWPLGRL
jgi:hypothetical protein